MSSTSALMSNAGSPVSPQHATVGEVRLNPEEQHHLASTAWHSPVPYLFGGLAAMLGLIAFALLILACSYWKLSSFPEGDVEAGKAAEEEGREMSNVVVIMAGQLKPTFLATPSTSRTSSFGDSVDGRSSSTSTSSGSEAHAIGGIIAMESTCV